MTDQIDTGTQDLLATLNEGVLTLTLNRPEARNAMSEAMNRALAEQLAWAEVAPSVKCVVLTGAGKGFCAGGDVKGMAERTHESVPITPDEAIYRQRVNQRATAGRLFKMPKPTLAALPGAAAGAGLAWALACDLRIMSRTAILTTAFARVGFSGDYGGTYFLTKMLGSAKARELYLLSPVLTAQEALSLGMVTKVVADAEVDTAAHELAMSLAQGPSVTLGYIKRNINNAEHLSLEACFDAEAIHHSRAGETVDHKEAAKAFVEKRKPAFQGR